MGRSVKVALMAIECHGEMYSVVRVRVPYAPKVMDVNDVDDMFTLFWKYTTPQRMSYNSMTTRKLPKYANHVEKVLGEAMRFEIMFLVLPALKDCPDWVRQLKKRLDGSSTTVVHISVSREDAMPAGLKAGPDLGMMQCNAWRRLRKACEKVEPWTVPQTAWTAPPGEEYQGQGEPRRAGRRGAVHAAGGGKRVAKVETVLTDDMIKRITAGEDPDEVLPAGLKIRNAKDRKRLMEAKEEGIVNANLAKVRAARGSQKGA